MAYIEKNYITKYKNIMQKSLAFHKNPILSCNVASYTQRISKLIQNLFFCVGANIIRPYKSVPIFRLVRYISPQLYQTLLKKEIAKRYQTSFALFFQQYRQQHRQ